MLDHLAHAIASFGLHVNVGEALALAVCGTVSVLVVGGAVVWNRRARERERRGWLRDTLLRIDRPVILTDLGGTITAMSTPAALLTGWPEPDAVGKPVGTVFRLVDARTWRPVVNPVLKALHKRVAVGPSTETLLIAQDGMAREVCETAIPIRDEHGRTFGCALAFRELKHSAERGRADRSVDFTRATASAVSRSPMKPSSAATMSDPYAREH